MEINRPEELKVPALGRPFGLGMLYDCRNDTLLPSIKFWNNNELKKNVIVTPHECSSYSLITGNSLSDKMKSLDVSTETKVSLLGGMLDVNGSASFLEDYVTSNSAERVTFKYKCTTTFQNLNVNGMKKDRIVVTDMSEWVGKTFTTTKPLKNKHPDVFGNGTATHVVTAVLYGVQAFFAFDKKDEKNEAKMDLSELYQTFSKDLPKGKSTCKLISKENMASSQFQFCFYSDICPPTNPTNYAEAKQLCHDLPNILNRDKDMAVPLFVWLHPLVNFDPEAATLVAQISDHLVARIETYIGHLNESIAKTQEIKSLAGCRRFKSFCQLLEEFKSLVERQLKAFQKVIALIVPAIRSGEMEEPFLEQRIKSFEKSPFKNQNIATWLYLKEKEAKLMLELTNDLKDMPISSTERLQHFPPSDVCYLACFVVRHQEFDDQLLSMKKWFDDDINPEPCKKKRREILEKTNAILLGKSITNKGISDIMEQNAGKFKEFFQANQHNSNLKFMICEEYDNSQEPGGLIYLYKEGLLTDNNFEPPSKPSSVRLMAKSSDSVTIRWKVPETGSVQKFDVQYRNVSTKSTVQKITTSGTKNNINLTGLKLGQSYSLRVRSVSDPGVSLYSEEYGPFQMYPISAPSDLTIVKQTPISTTLTWSKPKYVSENAAIRGYDIFQNIDGDPDWEKIDFKPAGVYMVEIPIKANQPYRFKVAANGGLAGNGAASQQTKLVSVSISESDVFKAKVVKRSDIVEKGRPNIYRLPIKEVIVRESDLIRKYEFGRRHEAKKEKVVLVVGATGSGKTTLLNGLINFVLGVSWKDEFRFKLILEESDIKGKKVNQAKSQTTWLSSYRINHEQGFHVPYTLTIIDTPGFGDTGGIMRDKQISDQIRRFFTTRGEGGIDHIDAIGFVVQSSLSRLTPTQQYIFDTILALFGKDMKENIFLMATFADGQRPPVISAVEEARLPYQKLFKFNNSALFAENKTEEMTDEFGTTNFDEMFWNMGERSFKLFLNAVLNIKEKSLLLTQDVLSERAQLEIYVQGIQTDIQLGLNKLEQLQIEEQFLRNHTSEMNRSKNFIYTVDEETIELGPIDKDTYTTNCLTCKRTCHYPCIYKNDDDKIHCSAMENGVCRICTNHCAWDMHKNLPHKYDIKRVPVKKTSADLKARYEEAQGKKFTVEQLLQKVVDEFKDSQHKVLGLATEIRKSLARLQDIALKPSPLSTVEYIDILIDSNQDEAKPGWKQRVEQLRKLRKEADCMQKLADEEYDPFQKHLEPLMNKKRTWDIKKWFKK